MHRIHVATLLLAAALFLVLPASAANTITFDPASVTVSPGSTASFTMRIDSLPGGLAGYDGNISIGDLNVAVITAVTYPSWAILNSTGDGLPSGHVRLSGVDIGRVVGPSAANIDLATITVQGNSAGTTTLTLTDARLDADGGEMIAPLAAPVSITVPGTGSVSTTTSSSSSGGTSSGSGGTPYEPVPVSRYTLAGTAVQPAATSSITQTLTVPGTGSVGTTTGTGSNSGGGSGGSGSPAAAVTSQNTPLPATTSPNPGMPALPLTWIAGGVVVLVIIALVMYLTMAKKI
jgi:hypothetical protein